ncbi:hypothetical protein BH09SUM1_BH09SUM1_31770 [soil metagenome]
MGRGRVVKNRLAKILGKEIDRQLDLFSGLWAHYESPDSGEAVHRQRTAVNRLDGYAQFLGVNKDAKNDAGRALRALRNWQRRIGTVRDVDVLLEWLEKCHGGGPDAALAAFHDHLSLRRHHLLKDVIVDARSVIGAEARVAQHSLRQELHQRLHHFDSGDFRSALEDVASPWREALDRLRRDHGDETLHAFRVKNKRLRFVLDALAEGEEWAESELLKRRAKSAGRAHGTLGNLADLAVFERELRQLRAEWSTAGCDLDASAAALEAARAALEAKEFAAWFAQWPSISAEDFLGALLKD